MKIGLTFAAVLLGLSAVSCGKKQEDSTRTPTSPGTYTPAPKEPRNDHSKPYLTDEKMQKFIASMTEEKNPLEFLFGSTKTDARDMKARLDEYNAYARKYGFDGYEDYLAVWGRIRAGQMLLWSEDFTASQIRSQEESIRKAQEQLKKPDLSPDWRKIYEDQVRSYTKSVEELRKPKEDKNRLNDADLALIKKYAPQIEEAQKKHKKQPAQKAPQTPPQEK